MRSEFLQSFEYAARGLYFILHYPNAVIEMIKGQFGLYNDVDVRLWNVTKSTLKTSGEKIPDKGEGGPSLSAKIFSDKT